jgi:uncharacterized membrane protein
MRTPASVAKHPIHPMLVAIPIGLWVFSLACDVIRVMNPDSNVDWAGLAWYSMVGGIIGALVAAVPGFIDMLSLREGLKRIALVHMTLNLTVVALYVVNAYLRTRDVDDGAVWLSVVAAALLICSGWLGGKMVHVHGVSVETPPEPVPPARAGSSARMKNLPG